MARHFEAGEIIALPVQAYSDLRPTLRSGDLLFASGEYTVSRLIRHFTHSPWSHVGTIFALEDIGRVLLLESVEDFGVRLVPVSKYLNDYDNDDRPYQGKIVIARPDGVTGGQVKQLAEFGADELGRPYDREEIAVIAARIALHRGGDQPNGAKRTYICSELV